MERCSDPQQDINAAQLQLDEVLQVLHSAFPSAPFFALSPLSAFLPALPLALPLCPLPLPLLLVLPSAFLSAPPSAFPSVLLSALSLCPFPLPLALCPFSLPFPSPPSPCLSCLPLLLVTHTDMALEHPTSIPSSRMTYLLTNSTNHSHRWALVVDHSSHHKCPQRRAPERGDVANVPDCMQGLLRHVLDHNKHVQEAACSALATLEEQSTPEQLVPRLKVILETLAKACATYGRKNLRILYDAISTLAELVGEHLAVPNLLRVYMPPLVAKWQSLADSDRDLLPLLECFTAIAPAIGETQLLLPSFPFVWRSSPFS